MKWIGELFKVRTIGPNKIKKTKQTCWVYCPFCDLELVSSNSLVLDKELVTYKCERCGAVSTWDFDSFPVPVITMKRGK